MYFVVISSRFSSWLIVAIGVIAGILLQPCSLGLHGVDTALLVGWLGLVCAVAGGQVGAGSEEADGGAANVRRLHQVHVILEDGEIHLVQRSFCVIEHGLLFHFPEQALQPEGKLHVNRLLAAALRERGEQEDRAAVVGVGRRLVSPIPVVLFSGAGIVDVDGQEAEEEGELFEGQVVPVGRAFHLLLYQAQLRLDRQSQKRLVAHLCNFRLQILVREDLLQILRQLLLDDGKVEWLVALHNCVHDLAL